MICKICGGTGESKQNGMLDCAEPGCDAATDRAKFNEAMAKLPPMTTDDVRWAAYQAGERIAEQRWQTERAELIRQLRKMWGWAIELDHSGGFFCATEEDAVTLAQWKIDTREVLALLQKEPNPTEKK